MPSPTKTVDKPVKPAILRAMNNTSQWSKPSKTRDEVIAARSHGLKAFDKTIAATPIATLIERAIALHNSPEWSDTWGPQTCWTHFDWCFGNVWREAYHNTTSKQGDISTTFNLDEVLSPEQLADIKQRCGITCDVMSFGNPRKNGIRYNHCQMHDDPEKYAYR